MSWIKQSDGNHPPETDERSPRSVSPNTGGPSMGRFNRKIVLVELNTSMPRNMLLQHRNSGVQIAVAGICIGEHYVGIRRNHECASHVAGRFLANGRNKHRLALMSKAISHNSFDSSHGQVIQNLDVFSPEISNDHFPSHQISLSVGHAPNGAGVGTSESTERVYQSYGTNQEKPPAGATAEGNETNNQR